MPKEDGKSTGQIIFENVFTLFNGLNLLLAAALILVGSYRNMMFLGVVVWNTGIAIFQEIRARNTIRRLKLLNAPRVHVIREGRETTMPTDEAAEGDVTDCGPGIRWWLTASLCPAPGGPWRAC